MPKKEVEYLKANTIPVMCGVYTDFEDDHSSQDFACQSEFKRLKKQDEGERKSRHFRGGTGNVRGMESPVAELASEYVSKIFEQLKLAQGSASAVEGNLFGRSGSEVQSAEKNEEKQTLKAMSVCKPNISDEDNNQLKHEPDNIASSEDLQCSKADQECSPNNGQKNVAIDISNCSFNSGLSRPNFDGVGSEKLDGLGYASILTEKQLGEIASGFSEKDGEPFSENNAFDDSSLTKAVQARIAKAANASIESAAASREEAKREIILAVKAEEKSQVRKKRTERQMISHVLEAEGEAINDIEVVPKSFSSDTGSANSKEAEKSRNQALSGKQFPSEYNAKIQPGCELSNILFCGEEETSNEAHPPADSEVELNEINAMQASTYRNHAADGDLESVKTSNTFKTEALKDGSGCGFLSFLSTPEKKARELIVTKRNRLEERAKHYVDHQELSMESTLVLDKSSNQEPGLSCGAREPKL